MLCLKKRLSRSRNGTLNVMTHIIPTLRMLIIWITLLQLSGCSASVGVKFVKFVRVFNNVTADSIAVKTGIMSPVQCTNYCFNTLTCDLVRYTESDKTCNLLTNLQEDLFVVTLSGPSSSSDVSTYARTVSYICQPMHEQ